MSEDFPVSMQRIEALISASMKTLEAYIASHAREHALLSEMVVLAKVEVNKRLEAMNELREQINMERGTYQTKEGFDQFRQRIEERLNILDRTLAVGTGGSAGSLAASERTNRMWLAGIGIAFTILNILIKFWPGAP